MRRTIHATALFTFALFAPLCQIRAQAAVAIRELAKPDATSAPIFGNVFSVRQLSGGGVLVNDGANRQLLVLDSRLSNSRVLIDSVSVGGQSYGPRAAPLIPYLADSTLFVDGASLSLLVIDPAGKIARVMSAPQPGDVRFLAASAGGVDAKGNLIYRGALPRGTAKPSIGQVDGPQFIAQPALDSAPILRANFDTRKVDTLAKVKVPSAARPDLGKSPDGKSMLIMTINPMITVDEWAVLSNGAIALVRGHDYHIDWIQPDGRMFSSPKMPFDWKRVSDAEKLALIDSARTAQEKQFADAKANGVNVIAASKRDEAGGGTGGFVNASAGAAGDKSSGGAITNKGSDASSSDERARAQAIVTKVEFVPLKEIADYYPAIRAGAAKPDLDGNLWILPTTSAQSKAGELIYDVVKSDGRVAYRVRVPLGRSIAGFGRNGVVYLMQKGAHGWMLERSSVVLN